MPTGQPFFPQADRAFAAWADNFAANTGVFAPLNLPLTFFDLFNTRRTAYGSALDDHDAAQSAAQGARQAKDAARGTLIDELRNVVRQLRAHPGLTNEMVAAVGLPVYDEIPSPIAAPDVAPELEAVAHGPQGVRIRFWDPDNPAPGRRGKPPGARACRLVYAIVPHDQPAPPLTALEFLASDTRTPNDQQFEPADVGKTLWVRGAWESPTGELGPYSEPSSVTIPA